MQAKRISTPSQEEGQELSGFPDEIRQIDLTEVLRLRYRLRLVKDELASLEEQIRTQLTLGLPVQKGQLAVKSWQRGPLEISPTKQL
ncbi:MAG: hypothetical protein ABSF14_18300 [Terriglobia bacterium]|jgi:hypothetical protein